MKKSLLIFTAILLLFSTVHYSQSFYSPVSNLKGFHSAYFQSGVKLNSSNSVSTSLSGVDVETQFVGFAGYQYWFDNEWSLNAFGGMFNVKSNTSIAGVSSISIFPTLMGVSYYPENLTLGDVGRVYFSGNIGIYSGTGTKASTDPLNIGTTTINESVLGVTAGAGVDVFVTNWLRLGPYLSYHFVSEFSEVIGERKNYSGPVFSFNAGFVF